MHDLALAYIDPGSGSLIIQVLIASILAVPYFLRNQIGRAVGRLRRRDRSEGLAHGESDGPPPSDPG